MDGLLDKGFKTIVERTTGYGINLLIYKEG